MSRLVIKPGVVAEVKNVKAEDVYQGAIFKFNREGEDILLMVVDHLRGYYLISLSTAETTTADEINKAETINELNEYGAVRVDAELTYKE